MGDFTVNFEITDNASGRVYYLLQKRGTSSNTGKKLQGLRVSVHGGGCSGFMYDYELVAEIFEEDVVIDKAITQLPSNVNNDNTAEDRVIKIIIDPLSFQFLKGCTLDFVEELGSSYFQIMNPGAVAKCGCGNSFAV